MTRACRRRGVLTGALLLALFGWAGPVVAGDTVLPGYARRISGEVLEYHSADPDVELGLLVRSLDAARAIEWETAPVPADFDGATASFVWLFGVDVNPRGHRFELSVDGAPWFELENPPTADVRDWTVAGPDGASLRMRATSVDRFGDLMGYAILRVPHAALEPGRPLRLAVAGESADSRAWYIAFQAAVSEGASLSVEPALLRDRGGPHRPVTLAVTHLGEPVDALVTTSFGPAETHRLELGGNRIELRHPSASEPGTIRAEVTIDGEPRHSLAAPIEPVRRWTVDLVQHTHTDIGYTRPQTEILPEHLRFIDTALDYCDQTDGYPEEARFRWTCEASWAVREYLESRPAHQVDRLRRRVEEGRIEVTGMFLNMSEVVDEASYAAFLRPIRAFREHGLAVTTAMQNDINGAAWCLADLFAPIDVDYLTMGQHEHRALAPFDVATPFWWESPAGNRVLAFRADHYQTGNFWGVHTGEVEPVADELLRYLSELDRAGYAYDRVAVQHSGYPTDNSPPSTASSELVRAWNERYVWPRLRCSVARDYVQHVAENHADELPVRRQAWPDWWADGFGSAARESAAAREVQTRLVAVEGLLAMETLLGLETPGPLSREVDEIRDDLLFYGEHTFGAAESVREPLSENSVVQWMEKAAYAWDAVKRVAVLGESALGRLPAALQRAPGPRLLVVNTLGFPRSGLLELYVDHALLPLDRPFRILDEEGTALPVQLVRSRDEGSYWAIWVRDVPALGWRTFRVEIDSAPAAATSRAQRPGLALENAHYRLEVDETTGAVESLVDLREGRELVDADADFGLGALIHESLGNREQLEGFFLDDYERRGATDVVVEGIADGPVWSTLAVRGELPGCEGPGGARWEVRLFHPAKRLELHYRIQKRRVFDPEGLYVAFPFGPADGRLFYETLGGIADVEEDVLAGAASDWQAMQSFAGARWPEVQVVLSSDEIPLVQLGGLNLGEFAREVRVDRPHVYSWVMNNYWTTNFRASQEGELRFSYALTSGAESSRAAATRFGWSHRVPLLGRVLPGGGDAPACEATSLLTVEPENLLLVAARPATDGAGVVLHLREVEGRPAQLDTSTWKIAGRAASVRAVDVLELSAGPARDVHVVQRLATQFLLVEE